MLLITLFNFNIGEAPHQLEHNLTPHPNLDRSSSQPHLTPPPLILGKILCTVCVPKGVKAVWPKKNYGESVSVVRLPRRSPLQGSHTAEVAGLYLLTRVSLSRRLEHELSLIWGPVQNQISHPRGPKHGGSLRHSAL